jgi:glycosyltransferase involved in cell wall biosynthesis
VLFVPPGDPEALAGGLERIVTDTTLRTTLAARGPARAEGYTWARTAETTMQGYRVALDHAAGRRRR